MDKKLWVVRLLNWNSLIEVALEWIANRTQLIMVNCDGWSTAEYGNSNELDIKVQRSGRMLVIMLSFCHVNILRKRSYQTYLQVINTYWIFVIFCVNSSRRHINTVFSNYFSLNIFIISLFCMCMHCVLSHASFSYFLF